MATILPCNAIHPFTIVYADFFLGGKLWEPVCLQRHSMSSDWSNQHLVQGCHHLWGRCKSLHLRSDMVKSIRFEPHCTDLGRGSDIFLHHSTSSFSIIWYDIFKWRKFRRHTPDRMDKNGIAELGKIREKKSKREKIREEKSQRSEDAGAGKGGRVVKHCFSNDLRLQRVESRLAKAVGAEKCGQMIDEQIACRPMWREAYLHVKMFGLILVFTTQRHTTRITVHHPTLQLQLQLHNATLQLQLHYFTPTRLDYTTLY